MQNKSYIGVDIGGTSIIAGLVVNNQLEKTHQEDTLGTDNLSVVLEQLYKTIDKIITPEVTAIGIGTPGYMDVEKGQILLINNIPCFREVELKKIVSEHYNLPVFINNDANCFALGETYFGAGKGLNNVIGITLGTGLGGGIILNKKVYAGMFGGAGEFGCLPYKDGIFEDYCSSKLFLSKYNSTGLDLFIKAENGDPIATSAFNEMGTNLGELIKDIMFILAPDAIIIGGSIAKSFKYIAPPINEIIQSFPVDLIREKIQVKPAELDNAGVFGAAALCISELE